LRCAAAQAFRPFDRPSGDLLRPRWQALHNEAGDLWKPKLKEGNPERLGHIAEAQGVFALVQNGRTTYDGSPIF
jgi:hypothetical protein